MASTFTRLKDEGLLQPLTDTPMLNPLPKNFKMDLYSNFHQINGHEINKCQYLYLEIQNLIDDKKIPNPKKYNLLEGNAISLIIGIKFSYLNNIISVYLLSFFNFNLMCLACNILLNINMNESIIIN